jgi:hypothetical protein
MYTSDSLHLAEAFQVPVVFMVFNRPGTTQRVFDTIAAARPAKLLLIADGPRQNKEGEAEACRQVRDIVSHVDWPCEVFTNFAEDNLGCQERIISGLNWVFSLVEEAIILEDDCLPDSSFFPFCEELLKKYKDDRRIAYICGSNLVERYGSTADSYFFSRLGGIWGWATWRSEWQRYDRYLSGWPQMKARRSLAEIFDEPRVVDYWTSIFDAMYEDRGPDTWDHQWFFTNLSNNSLTIVPKTNLIANIGFGDDATHTTEIDERFILSASSMEFPLKHPSDLIPRRSLDRPRVLDMLPPSFLKSIPRKIRRVRDRLFR